MGIVKVLKAKFRRSLETWVSEAEQLQVVLPEPSICKDISPSPPSRNESSAVGPYAPSKTE
jgi:hypothetical protein